MRLVIPKESNLRIYHWALGQRHCPVNRSRM